MFVLILSLSEACVLSLSYLALVAALASEADWVLVPEWPPERGWEDVLCNKLAQVCPECVFILLQTQSLRHVLIYAGFPLVLTSP